MRIAIVFLLLMCFGATTISASISADSNDDKILWFNSWNFYFLQFNSPSGKQFYIDFLDIKKLDYGYAEGVKVYLDFLEDGGKIHEGVHSYDSVSPLDEEPSFITFVAIDQKIYNIYFDDGELPRVEKSKYDYKNKELLVLHRLHSFVGPNKKLFNVTYNDNNEPLAVTGQSSEVFDHFQIKTIGPYEKWEQTYNFTENGEFFVDRMRSAFPILPNRSIPLNTLEPNTFVDGGLFGLLLEFNAPSGDKYQVTFERNIVRIRYDDSKIDGTAIPYITFTEPKQRKYDIFIDQEDGHPFLVEKGKYEHSPNVRLYAFVAPNGILYRVDQNETGPILVSNSSEPMEIKLLLTDTSGDDPVTFIFSDNGAKLIARVDETDQKPLNKEPASIDEVDADYVMANLPFLTFYTPSGYNYHIFIPNGYKPGIAIERGVNNSRPLYITYFQSNGTKAHIYFTPGDDPHIEVEDNSFQREMSFPFSLTSFITPDHKKYTPEPHLMPSHLNPEEGLAIKILRSLHDANFYFVFRFAWTDYKFISALEIYEYTGPRVPPNVLKSLIGK